MTRLRWILAAAAVGVILFLLGRTSAPESPPTFRDVVVSPEALEALKPRLDDSFIVDLLDRTVQPSQVATAPGAETALVARFCGPFASAGALPPPEGVEVPPGPAPGPGTPIVRADETPVLYTGGKHGRSKLELFTATPSGAGQRLLFEGVHSPFEWGLDEGGRPFVETSRVWWVRPTVGVGAGAAAGAAVGSLVAGTGGSAAGAAVGAAVMVLQLF